MHMLIKILSSQYLNSKYKYIKCKILCLLFGFFISNVLSTIPAQTGDWGIIAASIIIAINEMISKTVYTVKKTTIFIIINDLKIGIIYGLLVDAFKLGS
nr:hypothetical protein [Hypnea sp.]